MGTLKRLRFRRSDALQYVMAFISRSLLKRIHWALIGCLMFGLFAPTLGHAALSLGDPTDKRIAICTSTGIQYISPFDEHGLEHDSTRVGLDKSGCVLCSLTKDSGPVASNRLGNLVMDQPGLAITSVLPSPNAWAPRWPAQNPRAPPLL
jgi:hypothetical protein